MNKDPGAEDRFKEAGEAYEVLKDTDKRKRYDTLGPNWKAGQGFSPPPGWQGGFSSRGGRQSQGQEFSGFSDFFDAFFGGAGGFQQAGGARPGGFAESQRAAQGRRRGMKGFDHEATMDLTLEEAFTGGSHRVSLQHTPSGGMQPPQVKTLEVKIPDHVKDGLKIRVPKQGGEGTAGGPPGDLYLTIRFRAHPYFKPDEYDLRMVLPIAPWEAAFGSNVTVPTLEGGKIKLAIKPGARSGQKLRLKDQGLPMKGGQRGDLFAELQIQVPAKLTKHEKELLEMLANRSSFNPRDWEK
ncbi:curved DNA-binding protein [bacterium BMS3Bbin04]|nr:curved DNA-binding protein [bacterium BMS3Bbin04]